MWRQQPNKKLKTCQLCYKDLKPDSFMKDKRTNDGLRNYCIKCEKDQKKKAPKRRSILDEDHSEKFYSDQSSSKYSYDDDEDLHGSDFSFKRKAEYEPEEEEEYDACNEYIKTDYPIYRVEEQFKIGVHKNVICHGESGSGKTVMLLETMWPKLNEKFDIVILFSKSLGSQVYKDNLTVIDRKCSFEDNFEEVMTDLIIYQDKCAIPLHILFVFDDMTTENLSASKACKTISTIGRNKNMSSLFFIHMLTAVSNLTRHNAHELWIKGARQEESIKELCDKFLLTKLKIPKYINLGGGAARKKQQMRLDDKNRLVSDWLVQNVSEPPIPHTGIVIKFPSHYCKNLEILRLPSLEMSRDENPQEMEEASDLDDDDRGNLLDEYEDI